MKALKSIMSAQMNQFSENTKSDFTLWMALVLFGEESEFGATLLNAIPEDKLV